MKEKHETSLLATHMENRKYANFFFSLDWDQFENSIRSKYRITHMSWLVSCDVSAIYKVIQ